MPAGGPAGYYTSDNINTWLADTHDDELLEPSPLERGIGAILKNSWFRVEWMQWNLEGPGNVLLGAPDTLNTNRPREFFSVGGNDVARVEDLDSLRFSDLNGIRGSFGFPTHCGLFEANVWALEEGDDEQISPDLPSVFQGTFIATTVTFNGDVTDAVRVYDVNFEAKYRSNVWGANAMFVFDEAPNVAGFSISPLVGFGYLSLREDLTQTGELSNPSFVSVINSETKNDIYGPKAGMRAEFRHEYCVVGLQTSMLVGANSYHANVESIAFTDALDPRFTTSSDQTTFSAMHEAGVYARVHVRDFFSLTAGFDVLTAFRVTRPGKNIVYDINATNGVPDSSNVHVDAEIDQMVMQGLRIGGEFKF